VWTLTGKARWLLPFVLGPLLACAAWAQDRPAEKPKRTKDEVLNNLRKDRAVVDEKITLALGRIGAKNFLAARSATDDAERAAERLREHLPWQPMFHQFDVAVDAMRTRSWGNAKDAIDAATDELDFMSNFMNVEPIRPELDQCKEAMNQHNARLAKERMREVKRGVGVDALADPLRQTQAYLDKAKGSLTALPILIKSKRGEAKRNLERARTTLANVWPKVEDYMAGKMKGKLPSK
jgi:hypothetical protein